MWEAAVTATRAAAAGFTAVRIGALAVRPPADLMALPRRLRMSGEGEREQKPEGECLRLLESTEHH